ncbi:MAG: hypothetical protein QF470_06820 [Methylococcales bacterium]|jgi:hypothetical protein|nr:hypothetical protein [Methylococcales bacterium]
MTSLPNHLVNQKTIKSRNFDIFMSVVRHQGGFKFTKATVTQTSLKSVTSDGFKNLEFKIANDDNSYAFSMPAGSRLGTGSEIEFRYDNVTKDVVFCNKLSAA